MSRNIGIVIATLCVALCLGSMAHATAPIATDVINLADQMADQHVSFTSVTARYVQFVMPTHDFTGFYNDGFPSTDYVLPAEFELFAPEPASLGLLGIGGLLLRRQR